MIDIALANRLYKIGDEPIPCILDKVNTIWYLIQYWEFYGHWLLFVRSLTADFITPVYDQCALVTAQYDLPDAFTGRHSESKSPK